MDATEVAKTIREWAKPTRVNDHFYGPFPDCFALVARRALAAILYRCHSFRLR